MLPLRRGDRRVNNEHFQHVETVCGKQRTTRGSVVSAPVPVASKKGPHADGPKVCYLRCKKTTDRFT